MRVLVILAYPNPGSFNHAIAGACCATLEAMGHEVVFHDLYQEAFEPLLSHAEFDRDAPLDVAVARHCRELSEADGIVVVHPNWWGQPPAMLKGWIDRVIRPGVAYEFLPGDSGEGVPRGLLRARCALVLNTSNTGTSREQQVFGDPLQAIWKSCIFDLCGVASFHRRTFNVVVTSSEATRAGWLREVASITERLFPIPQGRE